jgi:hypothetical protein
VTITPNVAKVGGPQSQGVKGAAVVGYCKPLATPLLTPSGFPALSWRSSAEPEGYKRWRKTEPILEWTAGLFQQCWPGWVLDSTPITFGEVLTIFFMQRWDKKKGSMDKHIHRTLYHRLLSLSKSTGLLALKSSVRSDLPTGVNPDSGLPAHWSVPL